MSLARTPYPSPNYSAGRAACRLIVVHTAEGARTIESLGGFFADPSNDVSSHAGIDDKPGQIGVYVRRQDTAWTQAGANSVAVAAELCAFAAWDRAEWYAHSEMLVNCATWIAEEAAAFGIPVRKLSPAEAQGGSAGVCAHSDLGGWGGNHSDPGPGFPWDDVLAMAGQPAAPASPSTELESQNMIASTTTGDGYWTVTRDGAVYAFGDADYRGGANSPEYLPGSTYIVGIAGKDNDGYWLLASDGSIYAFGTASFEGRPDRV